MVTLRTLLLIISTLMFQATPAISGDFASREILGFSEDGTRFAFEEYGIQDGSGFPYANIYLIDTTNDSWVAGSPFRARIDEEAADIAAARAKAREMAGANLDIITQIGTINATNQPLEIVSDPMRMVARPFTFNPPTDKRIEFRLEAFPMASQQICEDFGGSAGFRLLQISPQIGGTTRLLHEDTAIPQSRNCPTSYRFADIVTYRSAQSDELVIAILVLFEAVGFEGPDGRYLAVTTRATVD